MNTSGIFRRQLSTFATNSSQVLYPSSASDRTQASRLVPHYELDAMPTPPIDNLYADYDDNQTVADFQRDGKIPSDERTMRGLIAWCLQHRQFNALTWLVIKGGVAIFRNLDEEAVQNLAEWLVTSPPVVALDLSGNEIGAAGARALANAIRKNTILTEINLTNNAIRDKGTIAIASALEENQTLKKLVLNQNDISGVGAEALARGLMENDTLCELDLGNNNVRSAGGRSFASLLEVNKTLTRLKLSSNQIGDEGAEAIASVLGVNKTLTNLDVSHNNIRDDGASALGAGLEKNHKLSSLNLGNNRIGDDGASALATGLNKNATLIKLKLGYNDISTTAATLFANALTKNSMLATLRLEGNHIDDAGVTAFEAAMKVNKTLIGLSIGQPFYCDGDEKAHQAINNSLQRNMAEKYKPGAALYINLCLRICTADNQFDYVPDITTVIVDQLALLNPKKVCELGTAFYTADQK
ncbi:MAG: protein NLRC3-like [Herminiimonas sp.]|nr:protein NLRC3-like [Herminiimonas sp.]